MGLGFEPEAVMAAIARRAQQLTGADSGVVELLEGDEMVYRAATGAAEGTVGLRLDAYASLSGLCARTGTILRCDDTETDPRVNREACRRVGARSMLVVPLRHQDRSIGVLKVFSRQAAAFDDDHVAVLEVIAGFVAAALGHASDRLALRTSEEQFRQTFDTAPIGMALVALDGQWRRVNRVLAETLGYTPAELLAMTFQDVTHPEDLARDLEHVARLLRGELAQYTLEKRYVHRSGRLVHARLHVALVRDAQGAPLHFVSQIEDVTERRALETRLQLADRMASVGTLASGVAHEINNPLSYIVANLETIAEHVDELAPTLPARRTAELREILAETRLGADRVRKIVRGLSTFSRAEQERRGHVEIAAILELSINMAFAEIKHRARVVKVLEATPTVYADDSRLSQVFINLLVNAAQAIPEGQVERNTIRVTTSTDAQGRAVVDIADTGAGIPAHVRPRIFDPFFTTKPIGAGTGLGLAICHGIVADHGGELSLEATGPTGSTFRVVLPAAPAEAPAPPPATAHLGPSTGRGRVLVVDDDALVARAIVRVLHGEHEVIAVDSGRAALARLADGSHFDLVICDLMMPELTGMDVYDELQRTSPALLERVIFVTGGAFTDRAREFLHAIPNQWLEKPVDPQTLRALVRGFVRRR